jgi:hypothetical protein
MMWPQRATNKQSANEGVGDGRDVGLVTNSCDAHDGHVPHSGAPYRPRKERVRDQVVGAHTVNVLPKHVMATRCYSHMMFVDGLLLAWLCLVCLPASHLLVRVNVW